MLYDLSMSESRVYVIQEIAGTKAGNPKINIMGASVYSSSGKFDFFITRIFADYFFHLVH